MNKFQSRYTNLAHIPVYITIPYKYEVDGIGDVPFDISEEDNE